MREGKLIPVKGHKTPRFNLYDVLKLAGTDTSKLSPFEHKRLEREISELQAEVERLNNEKEQLKGIIANVLAETSQVFNLKREAS